MYTPKEYNTLEKSTSGHPAIIYVTWTRGSRICTQLRSANTQMGMTSRSSSSPVKVEGFSTKITPQRSQIRRLYQKSSCTSQFGNSKSKDYEDKVTKPYDSKLKKNLILSITEIQKNVVGGKRSFKSCP